MAKAIDAGFMCTPTEEGALTGLQDLQDLQDERDVDTWPVHTSRRDPCASLVEPTEHEDQRPVHPANPAILSKQLPPFIA
jgi:hypothetical protein